jgi:hypothetical protein
MTQQSGSGSSSGSRRPNIRAKPDIRGIVQGAGTTASADVATSGGQTGQIEGSLPGTRQGKDLKSKRDRRSLYMDDATLKKLNDAYKQLNHDAFPQEVKKVSFLGAIVNVALNHGDELRNLLISPTDT